MTATYLFVEVMFKNEVPGPFNPNLQVLLHPARLLERPLCQQQLHLLQARRTRWRRLGQVLNRASIPAEEAEQADAG